MMASCSLNKGFVEDDIYYFPKKDFIKTEIVAEDSIQNKYKSDTLEIETVQDLNYAVSQGANASLYWENYFMYSPYSSSLGWDYDGDGIMNAFDLHPYSYDLFDDINNNGISDALEFGYPFLTNLDFIYWDLYYMYPAWRCPVNYNYTNIYYFNYDKNRKNPSQRRHRTLEKKIYNQSNTGVKKRNTIAPLNQSKERISSKKIFPTRRRYESSPPKKRINTKYVPKTNINNKTRNKYVPRTNIRSRSSTRPSKTRQNTPTRSSRSSKQKSSNSLGSKHGKRR
jgi:hypothetical protein